MHFNSNINPCDKNCPDSSLPCIENLNTLTQTLSYKILDVVPAWGRPYFAMIILNDNDSAGISVPLSLTTFEGDSATNYLLSLNTKA